MQCLESIVAIVTKIPRVITENTVGFHPAKPCRSFWLNTIKLGEGQPLLDVGALMVLSDEHPLVIPVPVLRFTPYYRGMPPGP